MSLTFLMGENIWDIPMRKHPEIEDNLKSEFRQLGQKLEEHRYESLPVKEIVLYKGEKARRFIQGNKSGGCGFDGVSSDRFWLCWKIVT